MKKWLWITACGWLLLIVSACFRNEASHITVKVPAMVTEQDARIVTNAALDEVVGSLNALPHDYEFDLKNQVIRYHESRRLMLPEYQSLLLESLRAVGFDAKLIQVGFNPIPPLPMPDGDLLNAWPDRFTAMIRIPGLDTVTEANIIADAIAYVRNGGDDPRVVPNLENCSLAITYHNVALSEQNLNEAIACAGYSANGVPPKEVPQGWDVFTFIP